jgi:hypothetical protein
MTNTDIAGLALIALGVLAFVASLRWAVEARWKDLC